MAKQPKAKPLTMELPKARAPARPPARPAKALPLMTKQPAEPPAPAQRQVYPINLRVSEPVGVGLRAYAARHRKHLYEVIEEAYELLIQNEHWTS